MRVTSEMMVTGSLRRLQGRLDRYQRAQEALATGKWVNVPSDDPAQASRGLALRAALQSREQEVRAANDARSLVAQADGELQGAVDVLQRIRELTVRAATTSAADERDAVAAEIEELQDQLLSVANGTHRGRAVFAGFQGGPAVQQVAGTWTYQGDQGSIERRVSDTDRVQVNVTADDVFGFSSPGADTFTMLDQLRADIQAGNQAAISAGIDGVDTALDHVLGGPRTARRRRGTDRDRAGPDRGQHADPSLGALRGRGRRRRRGDHGPAGRGGRLPGHPAGPGPVAARHAGVVPALSGPVGSYAAPALPDDPCRPPDRRWDRR